MKQHGPPEFGARATQLGVDLDHRQIGLLESFADLLAERAVPLGYVARGDRDRIGERHILDSLRAAPVLMDARSAYDLGSGAGLPGIPVGIARPDLDVLLVEPRRGRVGFLELALERLGLPNVRAQATRAEDLDVPVDACLARAFAPIRRTWTAARRLLRPGGVLVAFAGRSLDPSELPVDALVELVPAPVVLESSGPLVIMTRQ